MIRGPMLVPGRTYRVFTQVAGIDRVPQVSVMRWTGEARGERGRDRELVFDLRPLAGTQVLYERDVLAIVPAPNERLRLPHRTSLAEREELASLEAV